MARTLILNISAQAQALPIAYGSFVVAVGHGRVVADESSLVVTGLGGFEAMEGKWAVSAISTDTALGDFSMSENGLAMLAEFVSEGITAPPATWADLSGKPSFATVATSGSYADLTDKPVLADVATTGSYADLSGTPTLPSASNATPPDVAATAAAGVQAGFARADHQHAHGNLAGGSMHASATTLSAGFMSAADKVKVDGLATVATSGSYADLTNKPANATLTTDGFMAATDKAALEQLWADSLTSSGAFSNPVMALVAETGNYNDLINRPALATVATSGSYNDLTNKPTKTYDIASFMDGGLAVGKVIAQVLAPKNLTLTALAQTGAATVKVQVAGADITYPKSVTSGQVISVVVTVAGASNTFTISAVEA